MKYKYEIPTTNGMIYKFMFRNISWSTCSSLRRERFADTTSPAVENTRSLGTDVAIILK